MFFGTENGADPANNSKLDEIISRAKAAKMPKDSIESAIKSALRVSTVIYLLIMLIFTTKNTKQLKIRNVIKKFSFEALPGF